MKRIIFILSFVTACTFSASAQTKIIAKEAAKHVGEAVIVTGKIFGSKLFANTNMTLLDMGGYNPNQELTLMIAGADHSKFSGKPEEDYKGKEVAVTGKIIDYKGKPEIVLTDPSQIKVVMSDSIVPTPAKF